METLQNSMKRTVAPPLQLDLQGNVSDTLLVVPKGRVYGKP